MVAVSCLIISGIVCQFSFQFSKDATISIHKITLKFSSSRLNLMHIDLRKTIFLMLFCLLLRVLCFDSIC